MTMREICECITKTRDEIRYVLVSQDTLTDFDHNNISALADVYRIELDEVQRQLGNLLLDIVEPGEPIELGPDDIIPVKGDKEAK